MDIFKSLHLCETCKFKPATCEARFVYAGECTNLTCGDFVQDTGKVVLCNKYITTSPDKPAGEE